MSRERSLFGSRMRAAREAAGLSQGVAAEKIGISQGTLSELERTAQGSSHIVGFAQLYGVSPEWLATGEGQMSSKVMPISKYSKWPFELISKERWDRLTERQKGAVEAAALQKLKEVEGATAPIEHETPRPARQRN